MSLDRVIPPGLRWPLLLVMGIAVVVGATWAIDARINQRVDERAELIAQRVMAAMEMRLQERVTKAAEDGARGAVEERVRPLETKMAWWEGRMGSVVSSDPVRRP